jgi:REP element-mobilizing transposase RayT
MPRGARLDAPGTLHHVMVRGIERRNIVDDETDREDFIFRLGKLAEATGTVIYAWALMSNHAHILIRSGPSGLPYFMRRLLAAYAAAYNRRHKRYGHLFQNRYKSIICEEDPYFTELVRYIHLNPLRAGLVDTLGRLNRYAWCGHSVLLGNRQNSWQDRDYVLKWFGTTQGPARRAYLQFVKQGINQGRRPELVGGGLIRSMGGWSIVKSLRKSSLSEKGDERILGSSRFVESVIRQADEKIKYQLPAKDRHKEVEALIGRECKKRKISFDVLRSGSRLKEVSKLRRSLAFKLVNDLGLSLADSARQLGVSTSAIAQIMRRRS